MFLFYNLTYTKLHLFILLILVCFFISYLAVSVAGSMLTFGAFSELNEALGCLLQALPPMVNKKNVLTKFSRKGFISVIVAAGFEKKDLDLHVENGTLYVLGDASIKVIDKKISICESVKLPPYLVYAPDEVTADLKLGLLEVIFPVSEDNSVKEKHNFIVKWKEMK